MVNWLTVTKLCSSVANTLKSKGRLEKDTIVSTVMSNIGFHKAIEEHGMVALKAQVGDRYVVEAMREGGYILGGEQSGHIVFLNLNTTGDGLLSAVQLLAVMKETGKSLSELAAQVTIFPQKLVNIRVRDKHTVMDEPAVKAVIEAVEAEMNGDGRILFVQVGRNRSYGLWLKPQPMRRFPAMWIPLPMSFALNAESNKSSIRLGPWGANLSCYWLARLKIQRIRAIMSNDDHAIEKYGRSLS